MDCTFYHTGKGKVFCLKSRYVRRTILIMMVNDMIAGLYKRDAIDNLLHRLMFVEFGGLEQDITQDEITLLEELSGQSLNITHGKKIFGTDINSRKNTIIYKRLPISVYEREFKT